MTGIEPVTSSLPRKRSTPELHRLNGAEDEIRTRDIQLGRLMLYQLSYFRLYLSYLIILEKKSGGDRNRTYSAIKQRSYSPPRLSNSGAPPQQNSPRVKPVNYSIKHEPLEGLEPTTCWLQISCSSQLSYKGILSKNKTIWFWDCKCTTEIGSNKHYATRKNKGGKNSCIYS